MTVIYEWLVTFWADYFSTVTPMPDYIIEAFNWLTFGVLCLTIAFPLIVLILVFGVIRSLRMGGGRYDD